MKIAILNQHPSDTLGGSEIQCDIIARELSALGHEVLYVAIEGRRVEYDAPYRVVPIQAPGFLELRRILKAFPADVVYWRYNKIRLLRCALASRISGARFVYSISHISDTLPWVRSGTRPFERFCRARGKTLRARIRALHLLADPLISAMNYLAIPTLANGAVSLNPEFTDAVPVSPRETILNSMPTETRAFAWKRPFVLWVASIKPKKKPELFLELAKHLEYLDVDFLMVGEIQDGAYAYIADGKPEHTPSNFFYLGKKSPLEVNGMLEESLLLVHTCSPEGFGNNFIQAWLQGKPTVSLHFDPDGMIERNRLGYHSKNFSAFVENVRDLVENPDLRAEIGARAKIFAQENFSSKKNAGKLARFIERLT